MLTAEWGGSGGRPIESGMVVEEPDIEIGAGVSSKAISRRMQTDRGGKHGPKSSKGGDDDDQSLGRWRRNKDNRRDEHRDDRDFGNNQQPVVPEFPFGIVAGTNGMPLFPPGFSFPLPPNQ
jgi:protein NRD1